MPALAVVPAAVPSVAEASTVTTPAYPPSMERSRVMSSESTPLTMLFTGVIL